MDIECILCSDGPQIYQKNYYSIFGKVAQVQQTYLSLIKEILCIHFNENLYGFSRVCRKCAKLVLSIKKTLDKKKTLSENMLKKLSTPWLSQTEPRINNTTKRAEKNDASPKDTSNFQTVSSDMIIKEESIIEEKIVPVQVHPQENVQYVPLPVIKREPFASTMDDSQSVSTAAKPIIEPILKEQFLTAVIVVKRKKKLRENIVPSSEPVSPKENFKSVPVLKRESLSFSMDNFINPVATAEKRIIKPQFEGQGPISTGVFVVKKKEHVPDVRVPPLAEKVLVIQRDPRPSQIDVILSYSCSLCKQVFSTNEEKLQHEDLVHCLKCEHCSYATYQKADLDIHLKTSHIFKCTLCSQSCGTKIGLQKHIDYVHNKLYTPHVCNYKCNYCSFESFHKISLKKHLESCHEKERHVCNYYKCNYCSFESFRKISLKKHLESCHEKERQQFKCEICPFSSFRRRHLQIHMKNEHKGEKQFKCEDCVYSCNDRTRITKHIEMVHLKYRYQCDRCDSNFASNQQLKSHVAFKHEGKKRIKCDQCFLSFTSQSDLRRHIKRVHEKIQFYSRFNYDKYIYKCDMCNRSFRIKESLKSHIQAIHVDAPANNGATKTTSSIKKVKNLLCEICGKGFSGNRSLNRHIKIMHEGKIYRRSRCTCDICKKTFSKKGELISHLRSVHEMNESNPDMETR